MNLYLVIALALGAVSAAPVPERQATRVAAEARIVAQQPAAFAARRSSLAVEITLGERPTASGQRPSDVPLTGGATPRAPACIG